MKEQVPAGYSPSSAGISASAVTIRCVSDNNTGCNLPEFREALGIGLGAAVAAGHELHAEAASRGARHGQASAPRDLTGPRGQDYPRPAPRYVHVRAVPGRSPGSASHPAAASPGTAIHRARRASKAKGLGSRPFHAAAETPLPWDASDLNHTEHHYLQLSLLHNMR